VTVSTVGIVKNMYRLSDELPNVNLAFSLHAPNQDIRVKIVPAARSFPLWKLMDAVDYHIMKNTSYYDKERSITSSTEEKNNIGVTLDDPSIINAITAASSTSPVFALPLDISTGIIIEYLLMRDLNDRQEHAHELAQLLQSRRSYITLNLIPYNRLLWEPQKTLPLLHKNKQNYFSIFVLMNLILFVH
jgi:23S rRNA (adenine2503-C2)-methyltransferase